MWKLIVGAMPILAAILGGIFGIFQGIDFFYPGMLRELIHPSPTPIVTLTVSPPSEDLVTIKGDGINCGADCSQDYEKNASVTLSAQIAEGKRLVWTGACNGTEATECILVMDDHKSVGVELR